MTYLNQFHKEATDSFLIIPLHDSDFLVRQPVERIDETVYFGFKVDHENRPAFSKYLLFYLFVSENYIKFATR